jgi:hypothetical protein
MRRNKHKRTSKKHRYMQRGGAWYNPFSWFNNSNPAQPQPVAVEQGQPANSIFGTLSNITNKTEETLKNAGQSLGQGFSNITDKTKDAVSGLMAPKKKTSVQADLQNAKNDIQQANAYDAAAQANFAKADAAMAQQMPQQMPQQMGGMPPSLNLTYPSWAGNLNVAKPTYWITSSNRHIGGRHKRSNKRKGRTNKRKRMTKRRR